MKALVKYISKQPKYVIRYQFISVFIYLIAASIFAISASGNGDAMLKTTLFVAGYVFLSFLYLAKMKRKSKL